MAARVRIGDLNTRVKLQAKTVSQSTATGATKPPVWSTTATVWAARDVGTGREFLAGDVPRGERRATWTIHYRSGVTNEHRLVEAGSTGNVWDIEGAIDPDGRRQWLRLETRWRD